MRREEEPGLSDARIIDGRAFADRLLKRIGVEAERFSDERGLQPGLSVVLVGEDPASAIYVRNKTRAAGEANIRSDQHTLGADTSESVLLALVESMNADAGVHGILVQLPLPSQIDSKPVMDAISPDKDVDGFHVVNVGRLATGAAALAPCTPTGCLLLLEDALDDLSGKHAVIVGRSNIVGKPMAQLLLGANCTVTICHSRTADLPAICRQADILIAATGRAEMIRGDWIKPGAAVIDVGINRIDKPEGGTRLVGDVAFEEAKAVAGFLTPVPGGVGPMTIACLLANTVDAARRQAGLAPIDW